MLSKIKSRVITKMSVRKMVYTMCFLMFCLINQRIETCSPLDGGREVFRNLTGVVMAVVILSHYRKEDFKGLKVPYLVWGIIGLFAAVLFYRKGISIVSFSSARLVAAFDIYLFGFILLLTYNKVFVERKCPRLNGKFFTVWLIMMALMIASRSDYVWPFAYLIMFGCFYLTDYTEDEQEELWEGAINGLIISLFLFQAWCCVFRPYDNLRYIGIFSNCNHNALYYLFVLAAVFTKYVRLVKQKGSKWLKLFYWLGIGTVYALLFMTTGRTAWLVAILSGLYFLWALKKIQQKKNFIRNGLGLLMSAFVMFPVVFGLIRYVPPVFHHPVWFFGEWSEEKVHSWDPWDSEKYTDMDELLSVSVGRILDPLQNVLNKFSLVVKAKAADMEESSAEEKYAAMLEQGYALKKGEYKNSMSERGAIYKYYFKHLNLFGHPYKEQGFQLLPDYWIGHAHNIFLQYGTDFGIIVMILFLLLAACIMIKLGKRFYETESEKIFAELLFFSVTILFGLLEYAWGVGGLSIMMMFLVWREVCVTEKVSIDSY